MADRSLERPGPLPQAERRIVNPTLVTPGPQPVEAGSGADVPQVLRGEVVGPRHARPRPVDNRRKAAAGAILLSATGAATALFLLMGKDGRQASAAPDRDTSTAAPDQPDTYTAALADSAVSDTPLRGSREEEPKAQAPAPAKPASQAPATGSAAAKSRTPASSAEHSTPSSPTWPSAESGRYGEWQDDADELNRWAEEYARQHADDDGYGGGDGSGSGPYGQGQGQGQGHGHHGNGRGGGYGDGGGYGGSGYGGGHRR
ncbi:hypothetical protein ABZU86_27030 [Streptomyces sp. NPDC005271]|uniref:hypothetical protein n=1 Tax=unclassified Streptomyces TaxID=2593676 RepID=UPI0033AC91D6